MKGDQTKGDQVVRRGTWVSKILDIPGVRMNWRASFERALISPKRGFAETTERRRRRARSVRGTEAGRIVAIAIAFSFELIFELVV